MCPVLFYIHGGAFTFDSAVMFNDSQIIHKYASDDIVYVIPAYRLGIFGLLDLGGDDVVPRNLALHGTDKRRMLELLHRSRSGVSPDFSDHRDRVHEMPDGLGAAQSWDIAIGIPEYR